MQKWEYTYLTGHDPWSGANNNIQKEMQQLGLEGWELVSVVPQAELEYPLDVPRDQVLVYWFKRPIT